MDVIFMCRILLGNAAHIERIVKVDQLVIGNEERKQQIIKAVEDKRCLVALSASQVVGYLIFQNDFFEQAFISLVIVSPDDRRKGIASKLMLDFENQSPTVKVFSSTNESNGPMHRLFDKLGYKRSGRVDNLDEGDPEIIYFKRLRD